jgi:hypothetical protein
MKLQDEFRLNEVLSDLNLKKWENLISINIILI